eukprot:m.136043 g.136043  ORF g.136043 m.136043 type:complete len:462 (-) comp13988_c0_seq1:268-1653(-)
MSLQAICVVVIVCLAAAFANGQSANPPEQIHIALAGSDANGNSNAMRISWLTVSTTQTSTVKWGTSATALTHTSVGNASVYYETFNHHAKIGPLSPSTTYYYQVGDATGGFSDVLSFQSAPLSTPNARLDFAVWGDLGGLHTGPTQTYLENIKNNISLMWHVGDIAYADDSFIATVECAVSFCYEKTYDAFMNAMQSKAAQLPYMTTPGNHEAECHSPACLANEHRKEALRNFTAYNTRFNMPSEETDGVLNMWYSFNYGPVHFISIDTDTGYPGAPEEHQYVMPCGGFGDMLTWLENDLKKAAAERSLRPWIFVGTHHPLYNNDTVDVALQKAIEDLMHKYGVDVYFCGHKHSYARTLPVYRGVVDESYNGTNKTVYITAGGAGNTEMHHASSSSHAHLEDSDDANRLFAPTPGVTAATDYDHYGISVVHVLNATTVHIEYVRTSTQTVFDEVYVTKQRN